MDIGKFGIWLRHDMATADVAREIETLGFGALWLGGSPPADVAAAEPALAATDRLIVGTSIVNVWRSPASEVAETYHRLDRVSGGRFILGIGIGHAERTEEFRSPFGTLVDYLAALDEAAVPAGRRVLAALGPRVIELSGQQSAGAIPYLTTPQHTSEARGILGAGPFLAPENKVVISIDADYARGIARQAVKNPYLTFANYRRNLGRLGFSAEQMDSASDSLIDELVPHGDARTVAARLTEHLDAGADHVAVQIINKTREVDDEYLTMMRSLASELFS